MVEKIIDAVRIINTAENAGMEAEVTIKTCGIELSVTRSADNSAYYISGFYRPEEVSCEKFEM